MVFEGIGFAATSNIAKHVLLEQSHFWSGLENIYVNKSIARALNIPQDGGLLVQKVVPVSPAGKMGLVGGNYRAKIEGQDILIGGDVILSVNGIPLTSEENNEKVSTAISSLPQGASFKVEVSSRRSKNRIDR